MKNAVPYCVSLCRLSKIAHLYNRDLTAKKMKIVKKIILFSM